jgi:hypothetical protein
MVCITTASIAGVLGIVVFAGGVSRPIARLDRSTTIRVAHVSASMLFSVLNSIRVEADALPAVRSGVPVGARDSPLAAADERASRRLIPTVAAWLVPASDQRLCLVYTVGALTRGPGDASLPLAIVRQCTTVAAAATGRLVVTQSLSPSRKGSGDALILGVVPDGVASVSVVGADGRTTVLRVLRNSYAGKVADPTAVTFSDRMGSGAEVSRTVPVASFGGYAATPTQ